MNKSERSLTIHRTFNAERTRVWRAWTDPETRIIVLLEAQGKRTDITFIQTGFESAGCRNGHREGWAEAIDNLSTFLLKSS